MLSQTGDVFFIGSFNADGQQHIKPVGDGAFSFEDLAGNGSDFDYNDGVLRIIRGDAATLAGPRSMVFGGASSAAATYFSGGINYTAPNTPQFIHSNGTGSNLISTGSAADTLVLYANKDGASLGAGTDRLHILSGSSDNNIDLGLDRDADRVYFYRPTADQGLSSLLNFDPHADTISLVNLDSTASSTFTITPTKATLLLDSKPMLELIGAFSADSLQAALRRSDRGAGDAMAAIAERGLLVAEMIPGLLGTSSQRSDGQWYGYNVDIARAIAEQLTGNPDALAIRPNKSLIPGLNDVRDGYADLGLLGSTSTLNRDVNLGIDFSKPYLVDMQSFLVMGLQSAAELDSQTIGVINGSTAKGNALGFLNANGITASVKEYATSTELAEALRNGEIKAIASDRTRLMGYQATINGSKLLEETFSIQPLAVALPENQSQLKDAVNWIVQAPAAAAELGIGSGDLPALLAQAERGGADLDAIAPQTRVFLELDASTTDSSITDASTTDASSLGKALGLARGFTQKLLARLGNATEMWQRHFPMASNIEQNTASEGGQLRSLPFLGQGTTDALTTNDTRGDLLSLIRDRGTLQVATGGTAANIGFSAPDANNNPQGVDVDIAKALAIAIFGDPAKLNLVTNLPFSSTFASVANGDVDLALRASTANLWRDGSFGVDFSDPYLATGLKVLTRSSLGFSRIDQLNGSTVGVIKGTTATQNLKLALAKTGESARIVSYDDATKLYDAFRSGEVEAIARDGALLAGFQQQLTTGADPIATTMLNGQLSYEPLAAIVDENQSNFLDLVNSVIAILKQAAELGVTSGNVNQKLIEANDPAAPAALKNLFQLNSATALTGTGITSERVTAILAAVGNIDQIVERSIVNPEQNVLARDKQMQRPL
jgi:general L-amino acid transport system substrate-binding protein